MNLAGTTLTRANLEEANLSGANLRCADLSGARLFKTTLTSADLGSASLTDAVLTFATLTGANLSLACFLRANLERAELGPPPSNREQASDQAPLSESAEVIGPGPFFADFRHANARYTDWSGLDLTGTRLQGADLSNAKLAEATSLVASQIAGANVSRATLPEDIRKFGSLALVEEASKNARTIFYSTLLGCMYSWLTIASTTDVQLLTNAGTAELPIIGTEIPVVGFYVVAPPLLLFSLVYFHMYLRQLWRAVADLPAIFPDGKPLDEHVYPWLLNGLVRRHFELLKERPPVAKLQEIISMGLAWWSVPITLTGFWWRYLLRQDLPLTAVHVATLAASVWFAAYVYRLTAKTLGETGADAPASSRKAKSPPKVHSRLWAFARGALARYWHAWAAAFSLGFAAMLLMASQWAFASKPARELLRANLQGKDVSTKPENYYELDLEDRLAAVTGAQLAGRDLGYAYASGAFFASAVLAGANLERALLIKANFEAAVLEAAVLEAAILAEANLERANLRRAKLEAATLYRANLDRALLTKANLKKALLFEANLRGADLRRADLADANLQGADLRGADLSDANLRLANLGAADLVDSNVTARQLSEACGDSNTKLPGGLTISACSDKGVADFLPIQPLSGAQSRSTY